MKQVRILWMDITGSDDHLTIEDVKKIPIKVAETFGYLIHEDKEVTTIATTLFNDKIVAGFMKIPNGCIIEQKEIK